MPDCDDVQKIVPHLWFDDQAREAARFYTSLFQDASIGATTRYSEAGSEIHGRPTGSVMTVDFHVAGCELVALNGGPTFEFTPAISFFVTCETEAEVDALWRKLSEDGAALLPLDSYDWSERYGWVEDRYGLSWQVALGELEVVGQKITPSLLFVGDRLGRVVGAQTPLSVPTPRRARTTAASTLSQTRTYRGTNQYRRRSIPGCLTGWSLNLPGGSPGRRNVFQVSMVATV